MLESVLCTVFVDSIYFLHESIMCGMVILQIIPGSINFVHIIYTCLDPVTLSQGPGHNRSPDLIFIKINDWVKGQVELNG